MSVEPEHWNGGFHYDMAFCFTRRCVSTNYNRGSNIEACEELMRDKRSSLFNSIIASMTTDAGWAVLGRVLVIVGGVELCALLHIFCGPHARDNDMDTSCSSM